MANTLTALAPVLYSAAREVPRETTGLIAAVATDFSDKGVAVGDTVTVPIAPVQTSATVTAAQTFTIGSNRTAASAVLTLNNFKGTSWFLTAEQERSLANGGDNAKEMLKQTVLQGIRVLVNGIETYLGTTMRAAASRGTGTAATAPFGSNFNILNDTAKMLTDNGSSLIDRHCVINTTAGVNMRNLAQLQKANEAGSSDLLRRGILTDLGGFAIRESAGIATAVTAGTATNTYVTNTPAAATLAIGTTTIGLDTGAGTVLAGDVVTFTGDTNKYVVKTGIAAAGDLVIQEPGLRQTLADGVTMTVGAAATANLAFLRQSTYLVMRPALQPAGAIAEQMTITDPQTGMSFLLLRSVGDALTSWYLRTVYDAFCPNPYGIMQVLG